jgi:ankyrin repeat protein
VKALLLSTALLLAMPAAASPGDDPLCAAEAPTGPALAVLATQPQALHRLFACPWPDGVPPRNRVAALLDAGAPADHVDRTGRSALHLALARVRQPAAQDIALLLLSRGASATLADNGGVRPLHLASAEADGQLSGELIALGADPLNSDNEGRTALDHAVRHPGNALTFAVLIDTAAADLGDDDRELLVEALIQQQRADLLDQVLARFPAMELDPIDASRALARLLWDGGRLESAERFWRAGADAVLAHSQGGGDLPWRLASLGHLAELDWLLADGFPLNQLPDSGFPPLYFANLEASRVLLARGADPNLGSRAHGTVAAAFITPPAPFTDGGVSLDKARLELLLKAGLNPNRRDSQGMTALERALDADQLWLLQALLQAGADPTRTLSGERSLLPKAMTQGRLPTIQALIRALPDVADRHPLLLLDYVGGDSPGSDIVEALLVAGLSANLAGAEGETALLRVARLQRWPLVDLLLRYGADPQRVNAQGCSLHCYSWSMPESLQKKYLQDGKALGWQWPTMQPYPSAFFALALSPMLALWLLAVAVALARKRPLWPGVLWMLTSAALAILVGGALFFDCQPCLINDSRGQHYLIMTVAALLFAIGPWRKALRRFDANAQQ